MLADMTSALETAHDGVALAAPQIGLPYRIFIVRHDRTIPPPPPSVTPYAPEVGVYINPEIVRTSRKRQKADEGCLSVRGVYGTTNRPERVTVKAQRADGSRFTKAGTDLLAQIFEHEVDHLNGILFIDRASTTVLSDPRHAE